MPELKHERSLGELFGDLAKETSALVRQEVALAKVELSQKAALIGRNVGYLLVGGAVLYAAVLTLIATLIIVLAGVMSWWLASLIVGALLAIVGSLLVSNALSALKNANLTPQQTVQTLKEDAQWAKEQIK